MPALAQIARMDAALAPSFEIIFAVIRIIFSFIRLALKHVEKVAYIATLYSVCYTNSVPFCGRTR
jgi:hypothetical protein